MPGEFRRLYQTGWYFTLPFTEVLSIGIGYLLMKTAHNEFADQHFIGSFLLLAGVVSGLLGWPLLFAKVSVFWFDIAYLVLGVMSFTVFVRWSGPEMTVPGLLSVFLGPGVALAGLSYLLRRAMAFYIERRKLRGAKQCIRN